MSDDYPYFAAPYYLNRTPKENPMTSSSIGQSSGGMMLDRSPVRAAPPPASPLLEEHLSAMLDHAKHIENLADRMHQIADRIMGVRPQAGTNAGTVGAPVPSPSDTLGRMGEAHGWIERQRVRLQDAVERLERL